MRGRNLEACRERHTQRQACVRSAIIDLCTLEQRFRPRKNRKAKAVAALRSAAASRATRGDHD